MIRRPRGCTLTDPCVPYASCFRAAGAVATGYGRREIGRAGEQGAAAAAAVADDELLVEEGGIVVGARIDAGPQQGGEEVGGAQRLDVGVGQREDRKSTRLNSSH